VAQHLEAEGPEDAGHGAGIVPRVVEGGGGVAAVADDEGHALLDHADPALRPLGERAAAEAGEGEG